MIQGFPELKDLFGGEFLRAGNVARGGDQEVAIVVGENVQKDNHGGIFKQDEILLFVSSFYLLAKEATIMISHADIIHSPGCPESIHSSILSTKIIHFS